VGPKQDLYDTLPVKRLIRLHMGMSKPASRDEFVFCIQYCSAQYHSVSETFLIRECHAVVTGARRALRKTTETFNTKIGPHKLNPINGNRQLRTMVIIIITVPKFQS
jgi:hypothetical protein